MAVRRQAGQRGIYKDQIPLLLLLTASGSRKLYGLGPCWLNGMRNSGIPAA
ncbi:hypothetical protein CBFG_00104 [Clostridiales bacterium 1_7_47FAA]|nr:hypothetical protein CBFG_00104 [Clostridiales bacterium 1_7_47FAA]